MSNSQPGGGKKNIFKLAWKNIFSYAWINAKMCFVFAILAFLVCLFTVYNQALIERRQEAIEESISANFAMYSGYMGEAQQEVANTYLDGAEHIVIKYYNFSERLVNAQGEMVTSVMASHIALEINGEMLISEDNSANAATFGGEVFTKNDKTELKRKYGYDSCIIGSMPADSEQVVLSQPLLRAFGLTQDVIGKQVSLYIKGEESPFFTGTVSGVVRDEFYSLTGHSSQLRVGILLHDSDSLFTGPYYSNRNIYALSDWMDFDDALAIREAGFYYTGFTFIHWIDTLDNLQIIANNLYYIIGTALAVGLVLTIFLMVGKYVRVFSRTSGILLTFGLERRSLYGLLLVQLLILCLFALPIALGLTIFGYYVINTILIMIKDINMGVSFMRLIGMFGAGVATVLVTAMILFVYTIFKIRRQTIKQFLSTEVR